MTWILRGAIGRSTAMLPCDDGIHLATDAYVASGTLTQRPTIVERTPYDRRAPELQSMAEYFAAHGYNVVLQDTRGRGDSEGIFRHYISDPHEGHDGVKLLDWIVDQPWSDGTVGTTGLSYTGANQQSLAVMNHPALKCQAIFDTGIDYGRRTVREEGAFVLGQLGTYALRMALSSPQARQDPIVRAQLESAREHALDWFRKAPWRKGDSPVSAIPEYEEWLLFAQDTTGPDARWSNPQMNIEPHLDNYPDIPILYLTSWYGHHVWSTFRRLERFAHHASPKAVVIGTWLHADPYGFPTRTGEVEFGADASLNTNEMRRRWFDRHLKGSDEGREHTSSPVAYFCMGGGSGSRDSDGRLQHGGSWKTANQWPPAGGGDMSLWLGGDGQLAADSATDRACTIPIDLARPVPTVGGSIKNPDIMPGFFREGAQDQREWPDVLDSPGSGLSLTARADVAAFRSEPFDSATEVTGPLYLQLWLSSTSPACDLSVKLVDEYPNSAALPNGFGLNLVDSYRRFASWTELIGSADAPTRVVIGPMHISNRFEPGHRLRVDITASSWPRFDRNPEADEQFALTVHCGQERPSRLAGDGVLHGCDPEGEL